MSPSRLLPGNPHFGPLGSRLCDQSIGHIQASFGVEMSERRRAGPGDTRASHAGVLAGTQAPAAHLGNALRGSPRRNHLCLWCAEGTESLQLSHNHREVPRVTEKDTRARHTHSHTSGMRIVMVMTTGYSLTPGPHAVLPPPLPPMGSCRPFLQVGPPACRAHHPGPGDKCTVPGLTLTRRLRMCILTWCPGGSHP